MAAKKKTDSRPKKRYKNGQINEKEEYIDQTKKQPTEPGISEKSHRQSVMLFCLGVLMVLLLLIPGTSGWYRIHNFMYGVFGIVR